MGDGVFKKAGGGGGGDTFEASVLYLIEEIPWY